MNYKNQLRLTLLEIAQLFALTDQVAKSKYRDGTLSNIMERFVKIANG